MIRVLDLFSGIGGFALGFGRVFGPGCDTVAFVESDPNCQKLLRAKWPGVPVFDDVRTVGKRNLPECDVVTGGFPCQDLSVAGKRAGLAGERSGLFYEMVRIVDELRPVYLVWENVPGLLSSFTPIEPPPRCVPGGRWEVEEDADIETVIMALRDINYFGVTRDFDAQYFGVAQRRERCFGVFARGDTGVQRPFEILSIAEGLRGYPAPSRKTGQSVAGTIKGSSGERGWPDPSDGNGGGMTVCPTLGANNYKPTKSTSGAQAGLCIPCTAHTLRFNRYDSEYGTGRGIPLVANCLQERDAKGADSDTKPGHLIPVVSKCRGASPTATGHLDPSCETLIPMAFAQNTRDEVRELGELAGAMSVEPGMHQQTFLAYNIQHNDGGQHKRKDQPNGGLYVNETETALTVGTTDLTAVAQVQWASGGGKVENPTAQALRSGAEHNYQFARLGMQVRRLTPTECERLQGFPDGWTAGFSDSVRYRMLGNAVCVNVVEWIAKRMSETKP